MSEILRLSINLLSWLYIDCSNPLWLYVHYVSCYCMCCVPLQTHRQQIQVSSSDGKGRCIVNVHMCTHLMYSMHVYTIIHMYRCSSKGTLCIHPQSCTCFYCVHVLNSMCCVSLYTHGYVYLPCTCAGAQQVSSGGKGVYKCIEVSCMVMYVLYTHRWTCTCASIICVSCV